MALELRLINEHTARNAPAFSSATHVELLQDGVPVARFPIGPLLRGNKAPSTALPRTQRDLFMEI